MKVVFLGPPGVGKGTQAVRVCAALGIPQISTGDLLRMAMKTGTPVGLQARAFIDQGQLVPDEVVIALVRERLAAQDCRAGYVLDGFPRTVPQAEALSGITTLDAVINLVMEDEALIRRLSGRRVCLACNATYHVSRLTSDVCAACGETLARRADDAPETVLKRLQVYHAQTAPLIDYYRAKGLVRDVSGALPLDEGFATIMKALGVEA
ncbi:MAG: adenylate kinase [Clostridia bacterium]